MKFAALFLSLFSAGFALAEAAPPAANPNMSALGQMPLFILMFAIFYFLVLRPQQKKAKEHQRFLTELKRGDMVVTQGGIIGTVRVVSDRIVTIEVDEGVCLKVLKAQITENASRLNQDDKTKALDGKPKTV